MLLLILKLAAINTVLNYLTEQILIVRVGFCTGSRNPMLRLRLYKLIFLPDPFRRVVFDHADLKIL